MDSSKSPKLLSIEPLTKEVFSPFGEVIECEGSQQLTINQGTTERFSNLATIDVGRENGQASISIFSARRRSTPIEIKLLERHPIGSQAFVPLSLFPWLVVVALTNENDSGPDFNRLFAFRARGDQGVNYATGVWHHPLLVLESKQSFLVIDRSGEGNNLDEVRHDGVAAIIQP